MGSLFSMSPRWLLSYSVEDRPDVGVSLNDDRLNPVASISAS
jgi:hypothetical protein